MAEYVAVSYIILITVVRLSRCCQVIQPANPLRTIVVTKGSSARLEWYPSLQGCFSFSQKCGYISGGSIVVLAEKPSSGSFQVVASLPRQFAGRLSTIPATHTLVIDGLQYNDADYQFRCTITRGLWGTTSQKQHPTYKLNVIGKPEFTMQPPSEIEVEMGSTLRAEWRVTANPKPSVRFRWLYANSSTVLATTQVNPFVFRGLYEMRQIPFDYCRERLQVEFLNSYGTSGIRQITVKVHFRPDKQFSQEAVLVNASCLRLLWQHTNASTCDVVYNLALKNSSLAVVFSDRVRNRGDVTVCRPEIITEAAFFSVSSSLGGNSTVFLGLNSTSTPAKVSSSTWASTRKTTSKNTIASTRKTTSKNTIASTRKTTSKNTIASTRKTTSNNGRQEQQQQHSATSRTIYIAFGAVLFVLLVVVGCLLRWNMRLRNKLNRGAAKLTEETATKSAIENPMPKENIHYMDLKGCSEQATYASLSERELYYENYKKEQLYENTFM